MLTSFASVALVFGLLGGLLWLLRRSGGAAASGRHIEVAETVPIAAGKYLSVVKVAGRALLLATTSDAVTLLTELDACRLECHKGPLDAAPRERHLLSPRRWIGCGGTVLSRRL